MKKNITILPLKFIFSLFTLCTLATSYWLEANQWAFVNNTNKPVKVNFSWGFPCNQQLFIKEPLTVPSIDYLAPKSAVILDIGSSYSTMCRIAQAEFRETGENGALLGELFRKGWLSKEWEYSNHVFVLNETGTQDVYPITKTFRGRTKFAPVGRFIPEDVKVVAVIKPFVQRSASSMGVAGEILYSYVWHYGRVTEALSSPQGRRFTLFVNAEDSVAGQQILEARKTKRGLTKKIESLIARDFCPHQKCIPKPNVVVINDDAIWEYNIVEDLAKAFPKLEIQKAQPIMDQVKDL